VRLAEPRIIDRVTSSVQQLRTSQFVTTLCASDRVDPNPKRSHR
jgi:hypothetical protein